MSTDSLRFPAVAWFVFSLSVSIASAQDDNLQIRLSTGIDFTSGDYGNTEDIEDTYVPLTVAVDRGRLGYRLIVPYLRVSSPSDSVGAAAGSGARITESGLGDIVGSVTLYDVISNRDRGIALDFTGKIKFATADEFKGLGTGEHDYSVQADFYRFLDQLTLLGSAGYKLRGDPVGLDLENVLFASVGGLYRFGRKTRLGLLYDYRESAFADGEAIREVTGFVSKQLNDKWRMQFYVLNGLSNSSPDWGAGILLKAAL